MYLVHICIANSGLNTPLLQVVFDYTAYNEQGRRIDTTYTKGAPARTRLGIQGLIPGAAP
jgi:hypothetical protein